MLTLSSCKKSLLPFFPHKSNSTLFSFLKRLLSKQLSLVEKKTAKDGLKTKHVAFRNKVDEF